MNDKTTLMTFPCDFSVKIMGVNNATFLDDIRAIILKHYPLTEDHLITHKNSKQGNYLAITAIIHTVDQPSLDALYQELTKHPEVKMVL